MNLLAQGKPNLTVDTSGWMIKDLGLLFSRLMNVALLLSSILVFAFLVMGGVQWITSGGDKGKTDAAKNRITAALVGLAIVASSYALMQVVAYFFGVNPFDWNIQRPF